MRSIGCDSPASSPVDACERGPRRANLAAPSPSVVPL